VAPKGLPSGTPNGGSKKPPKWLTGTKGGKVSFKGTLTNGGSGATAGSVGTALGGAALIAAGVAVAIGAIALAVNWYNKEAKAAKEARDMAVKLRE
jgi:hypothetical protein